MCSYIHAGMLKKKAKLKPQVTAGLPIQKWSILNVTKSWYHLKGGLNKWDKCLLQIETRGTPKKLSFHKLKEQTGH